MPRNTQLPARVRNAALLVLVVASGCSAKSDGAAAAAGNVTAGLAAVTKYDCKSCHGSDFAGSTKAVPGTAAYAANLTPDKDTGLGEWDAATIQKAILTGVDDEDSTLCATMPRFTSKGMTAIEATDIAAYLKSLPAVSKDIPEGNCSVAGAAGSGATGK
jgi:mono/diheme cytochrome c family protein